MLHAAQLREGRGRAGRWPSAVAVNVRAQSGLALVHILAALGYDWGLHLLLPLGADLELQVHTGCLVRRLQSHMLKVTH